MKKTTKIKNNSNAWMNCKDCCFSKIQCGQNCFKHSICSVTEWESSNLIGKCEWNEECSQDAFYEINFQLTNTKNDKMNVCQDHYLDIWGIKE